MIDRRTPAETDGAGLAQARERFLAVGQLEPEGVRQAILASWWRSRRSNVAADRLEPPYVRDPDLDTPLTRSAEPVLRHLREQLDGQPLSLLLTDASGLVLSRLTADAELERHLDKVLLAPGFSYAEGVVGTNGIGTALEAGRAMHVFGHEHYAEHLESLACAGVPIRHPLSGKTVGALDLTCWRRDAGPLLVTLAKTTAEQIRQALLAETGMREIALLQAYLKACRQGSGMVFALNNDIVMMNDTARETLAPGDQSALLRHAADALAAKRESATVDLPSGLRVRLHTRSVQADNGVAGGVVDIRVVERGAGSALPEHPGAGMLLPGLIGTAPLWRRACHEAEAGHRAGGWLVLEGEPGVGKFSLVRALHQRLDAGRRFTVVDGAEAASPTDAAWLTRARNTLAAEDGTVVLRHLERLHPSSLRVLGATLEEAARRQTVWAALLVPEDPLPAELARLLHLFPSTVHVPPLRHHAEDVEQLVPHLLRRLRVSGQLTCSPDVMALLLRSSWPGNVQQLLEALRHMMKHRRAGVLQPADLPPDLQVSSRRRLSTIEAIERDAIVHGLQDAEGNKALAARALGMSRATIYRKIRDYGINVAVG